MNQKIIKVGSSAAVTIPKPELKKLGVKIGDTVEAGTDARGVFQVRPVGRLSRADAKVMRTASKVIDRYRRDLEILAR